MHTQFLVFEEASQLCLRFTREKMHSQFTAYWEGRNTVNGLLGKESSVSLRITGEGIHTQVWFTGEEKRTQITDY